MSETTTDALNPNDAPALKQTVLLRKYSIEPNSWDAFLEVWHEIVPVRERHGFEVLFGFADMESNVFTWAIRHHGDADAAAESYYADPDRAALERVREYVTGFEITSVTQIR